MIEVLSQMHLAIAAALMAAAGLFSAGVAVSLYFLYERIEMKLAPRKRRAGHPPDDASSEKPKAAHA